MSATILKKMSVKTLKCEPKDARDSKYRPGSVNSDGTPNALAGKKVPLCVVYGRASGVRNGENRVTGDVWTAITGTFEGVCIQEGADFPTGEVFTSGVLFLPAVIHDMIVGALDSAGDGGSVKFAVKILAGYDDASPVGYRYYAQNLEEAKATDDLADLRNVVQPNVRANLGPVSVPQIAPPVGNAGAPEPAPAPVQQETPAPPEKKRK